MILKFTIALAIVTFFAAQVGALVYEARHPSYPQEYVE